MTEAEPLLLGVRVLAPLMPAFCWAAGTPVKTIEPIVRAALRVPVRVVVKAERSNVAVYPAPSATMPPAQLAVLLHVLLALAVHVPLAACAVEAKQPRATMASVERKPRAAARSR